MCSSIWNNNKKLFYSFHIGSLKSVGISTFLRMRRSVHAQDRSSTLIDVILKCTNEIFRSYLRITYFKWKISLTILLVKLCTIYYYSSRVKLNAVIFQLYYTTMGLTPVVEKYVSLSLRVAGAWRARCDITHVWISSLTFQLKLVKFVSLLTFNERAQLC